MYATYVYAAGATPANVLSDLVAILTGTTDKALLSAACVQASTDILTGYDAAGWTLHDAAASATSKVIKAPMAEDPTQFKYVAIDVSGSGASGYLQPKLYEAFNASTHVGTNTAQIDATGYMGRLNFTAGGTVYLSASARRIVALTYQSASYGGSTGNGWWMITERTRETPNDTVAAGYPPSLLLLPQGGVAAADLTVCRSPRYRNLATNADVTGTSATVGVATPGKGANTAMSTYPSSRATVAGALYNAVIPFSVNALAAWHFGGQVSSLADLWLLQPGIGAMLDETTYNGKSYVLWLHNGANNTGSLLVPKG